MAAISLSGRPELKPRQARSRRGGRVAAYAIAAAAHAGLVVLVSLQVAPSSDGGAAPVINLMLEPLPRFDSETPPAVASTAEQAAQAEARPQSVAASLRLRQPIFSIPSDLTLPTPVKLNEPSPRVQDAREIGDRQGTARNAEGAGSGAASAEASVAGATQGGGGQALGAAAAADTDVYFARVLAWIEQHKRHPGDAQGMVTVSFRLDRRGRVSSPRVVRSSGVRALDRSAIEQIISTQPFPRPEPSARWASREFTVNIDYRTRPGR